MDALARKGTTLTTAGGPFFTAKHRRELSQNCDGLDRLDRSTINLTTGVLTGYSLMALHSKRMVYFSNDFFFVSAGTK